MPELSNFMTKAELGEMLSSALRLGFLLQVNRNLTSPSPAYCASDSEIDSALSSGQYSYLLERGDYTRYPVRLRSFVKEGQTFWFPRPREGGPVIDVTFWALYEREGQRFVPPSLIAYDGKVINPETGALEAAGPKVAAAFKSLLSSLKKNGVPVRSLRRVALVQPGVKELLGEGWMLGPPFTEFAPGESRRESS